MDLDDIDMPNQVSSQTSRFEPKSKPKSKPNTQPDPRESILKAEPREFGVVILNKKEDEEATTAMAEALALASNGDVKMEDETLSEAKEESMEDDAGEEDVVVREINVFFNPPMDDNTKRYDLDDRCEEVHNFDQDLSNRLKLKKQVHFG